MPAFSSKSRVAILAVFAIVCIFVETVRAETELTGPAMLNDAGEYYRLTKNITASGTAFTITAQNVTLDLGEHTVTYSTNSSGYGVNIKAGNATVKNGAIIQGSGGFSGSSAVHISGGSNHELHHLVIKTFGYECMGILAKSFNNSTVHHCYIETLSTVSRMDGYGAACIRAEAQSSGGVNVYENILVGGHRGIECSLWGFRNSDPEQSNVYNNYIQHKRRPGHKAPFAISLGKCRNVNINTNQIISDEGRGIMCDGLGQGVPRGTDYVTVDGNRVDVKYGIMATGGSYVENNVMGIYDRYSSGHNTFENNIVIVDNELSSGSCSGFRIGSDALDGKMNDIVVKNNTIIVDREGGRTSAFRWGVVEEVSVINNKYIAETFSLNNWDANQYDINIGDEISASGNTEITLQSYAPSTPTGLFITKFANSYLLRWDDNLNKGEHQTYEYIVYRDGQKLPISPRGGTFYVDVDVGGTHTYSVSALTLSGNEGPKCPEVSTASAKDGWWDGSSEPPPKATRPSPPTGLKLK